MMWFSSLVSLWLLAPMLTVYGSDSTDMMMEGGGLHALLLK
jgi:hypothetical protein